MHKNKETGRWHWDKGIDIAIGSMKLLFLLNGASAVAILTFLGNTKASSINLVLGILAYALGAFACTIAGYFGYQTQLEYGNKMHEPGDPPLVAAEQTQRDSYRAIWCSIGLYLVGTILAVTGLAAN